MLFLNALLIYLGAWCQAWTRAGRAQAPLSFRRLAVLLAFPLFLGLQAVHGICLLLDNLLFPAYRRQPVRRPVFVLGIPRSGTTFLHRELAQDPACTAPQTWEVLFAPSLCQRYLIRLLGRADRALGRPVERLLQGSIARFGGEVNAVHPLGLQDAEEDYLCLLPAAGCFFMMLAFPQSLALHDLGHLKRLPTARRERLLDFYHTLLQRHAFFHGGGARVLSKNAAFASWSSALAERYPDAVFVVCVRDPATALASQIASIASARRVFGTFPDDETVTELFADFYRHWLECLRRLAQTHSARTLIVEQEWLRAHSESVTAWVRSRLRDEALASCRGDHGTTPLPPPAQDLDTEQGRPGAYAALQALADLQRRSLA